MSRFEVRGAAGVGRSSASHRKQLLQRVYLLTSLLLCWDMEMNLIDDNVRPGFGWSHHWPDWSRRFYFNGLILLFFFFAMFFPHEAFVGVCFGFGADDLYRAFTSSSN